MTCGTRFGIVKGVRKNWAKFVLQYVEDGIRDYRTSHPTYIRGCVLFLQLFYISKFYMTVSKLKSAVHFRLHGQMSKSRGAWLPKYTPMAIMAMSRYAKIQQLHKRHTGSKPSAHNDGHPYEVGCSHSDDPTETIEARLSRNSEHLMSLASSVAQDIATLCARSSGGQSVVHSPHHKKLCECRKKERRGKHGVHPCSDEMMRKGSVPQALILASKSHRCAVDDGPCIDHDTFPPSQKSAELQSLKGVQIGVQEGFGSKEPSPTPRRRVKHTAKRLVKPAAICKSPFVSQCVQLFPKISQQERLVADYALSKTLFDHQSNPRLRRVLWNPWQSNGKLRNMKNQSFEVLCHKQIWNARRRSKEKSAMKHS
ncbi:hypothetical protein CK203_113604 [Vitis vinifera]|uniref:Uncharacterized protein n=1 Tax=Vitis vinifera TaxID=29760 RepID=A0A438C9W3_VITVI|nr:hypothetical protein CK203_113604 [Vitis vinifera]